MRVDKMPYLEFHTSLRGFDVYTKKLNIKVYRWELYIRNYTFEKIREKFNLINRL